MFNLHSCRCKFCGQLIVCDAAEANLKTSRTFYLFHFVFLLFMRSLFLIFRIQETSQVSVNEFSYCSFECTASGHELKTSSNIGKKCHYTTIVVFKFLGNCSSVHFNQLTNVDAFHKLKLTMA